MIRFSTSAGAISMVSSSALQRIFLDRNGKQRKGRTDRDNHRPPFPFPLHCQNSSTVWSWVQCTRGRPCQRALFEVRASCLSSLFRFFFLRFAKSAFFAFRLSFKRITWGRVVTTRIRHTHPASVTGVDGHHLYNASIIYLSYWVGEGVITLDH